MQKGRGSAGWACLALASCVSACGNGEDAEPLATQHSKLTGSDNAQVVAVSRVATAKGVRIERKLLLPDGSTQGDVVDEAGRAVPLDSIPSDTGTAIDVITPGLAARMAAGSVPPLVDILLNQPAIEPGSGQPESVGQATGAALIVNGVALDAAALLALQAAESDRLAILRKKRIEQRSAQLSALDQRLSLGLSDAQVRVYAEQDGIVSLPLRASQIRSLSAATDLVTTVDSHITGEDNSFATARTATSTRAADLVAGVTGSGVGVYMTETGCPPAGFITNYTLLAGSDTNHSRNVSSIVRGVSPDSWLYCRGGGVVPQAGDLPGTGGHPAIHVITRSYGGALANSAYDSVTSTWDDWIYNNRVPVVQSAGNNGASTGYLSQVGPGLNVTTIGNYQDSNSTINAGSSYLDPTSKNIKPELSAPGTSIDAGGYTFTGTSQATPFVAAIAADFMSSYTWLKLKPALVRATAMAAATDTISGGFDAVGYGGIDYLSGYYSLGAWWWEGGNGSFGSWDAGDYQPNNGKLDGQFTISASGTHVQAVLCWLNRGTWTYAHLADAHAIGLDLDLYINDPSGAFVSSSGSYDNSSEVVSFTSATSGNYSFHVTKYSNRDTSSDLVIGLAINADY